MRQGSLAALAGMLLLLVASPGAWGAHDRGMGSLTQSVSGAHFVVHYASPTTQAYAETGLADFEEAYSRLVTGGTGTPNAGLNVPLYDGSGKTDVYLVSPSGGGGQVFRDTVGHSPRESYVLMDPSMPRRPFRFRAGHEFMHVIDAAYGSFTLLFNESIPNWAADFSLPDIEPGDNDFDQPWIPFDCVYADWETVPCGAGYGKWPFFLMLVELYGADVIDGLLDEQTPVCGVSCNDAETLQVLNNEIGDQGGGTLRTAYAAYSRRILDASAWTSTAVGTIHAQTGLPASYDVAQYQNAPAANVAIDHLGTRYVRVRNFGSFDPSGPDDRVAISVTRPAGLTTRTQVLFRAPGAPGLSVIAQTSETGSGTSTWPVLPMDPAQIAELWIPLVNDTETTNDLSFGYQVTWTRGAPTPPANDQRSGAQTVVLDQQAQVDHVYAGGDGASEAPGCGGNVAGATRGTWYRFTAPNTGSYLFDASASDFRGGVSLYTGATWRGCAGPAAGSDMPAHLAQGEVVDVYVGRHPSTPAGAGTTVRLLVTGPAAPPATTPTDGGTQTTNTTATTTQDAPPPSPPPPLTFAEPPADSSVPVAGGGVGTCSSAIGAQAKAKRNLAAARRALRRARGARRRRLAKRRVSRAKSALRRATAQRTSACG